MLEWAGLAHEAAIVTDASNFASAVKLHSAAKMANAKPDIGRRIFEADLTPQQLATEKPRHPLAQEFRRLGCLRPLFQVSAWTWAPPPAQQFLSSYRS